MFATRSELLEKIRLGEDSFLELKEVRFAGEKIRGPRQDELADELAAFANSRGGVLLMGVDDNSREVLGIPAERLDTVERLIRQACEDSIRPSLAPVIERLTLPDNTGAERPVIRIEVPPSLFLHQSTDRYFHRVGSSNRLMPPELLARLLQQRSRARLIRFGETPIPTATLADLHEPLWSRFRVSRYTDPPEQLLSKLAMASQDEEGVLRPTVAGIMLACRNPERFIPGAFIQAVVYRGSEISPRAEAAYQRDARDITGPLDDQIFQACDFVRKNMRVEAKKKHNNWRTRRYPAI